MAKTGKRLGKNQCGYLGRSIPSSKTANAKTMRQNVLKNRVVESCRGVLGDKLLEITER